MNINESTSLVNSLTPSAPDQTSRSQSTTGSSDGHSINDTASQNSFLANIGNAVTGWWTGNQAPTENQHEEITAARLTIPPNYRPTIIRETFAQRQIARQAAREAARQDQQSSSSSPDNGTAAVSEQSSVQKQQSAASQQRAEAALRRLKEQQSAAAAVTAASSSPDNGTAAVSEPSSVLKQPSVASQQRAEAVLRRLKEQQSAAAAVASSQTSPSSSAEKPHLEEMRLEHNSNNLSQPLLTRMGEISNRLDSLVTEIAAQSKVIQRAQQKLEEADEKLAQLTIEQLDSSERQR
ncbi:MAG: hypothetical protein FJ390_06095, partial [Verrucomicrobia bacterium]|nr:hypothetical protein [Verrucomicrobiota bacterium]